MKRINRRQFGKWVSGAALAPIAAGFAGLPSAEAIARAHVGAGLSLPLVPQQLEAPKPDSKLKLTPEQEERVKQAVERRDRQLAAIRSRVLPYSAEPAFVFRVKVPAQRQK